MKIRTAAALGAAAIVAGQPIVAQPNVDDYEHAIGLRSSWSGLTENIAEPAQWIEGTHRFFICAKSRRQIGTRSRDRPPTGQALDVAVTPRPNPDNVRLVLGM